MRHGITVRAAVFVKVGEGHHSSEAVYTGFTAGTQILNPEGALHGERLSNRQQSGAVPSPFTRLVTSRKPSNGDQGADPNKVVVINDLISATQLPANENFNLFTSAGLGEVLRGISFSPSR